MNCLAAILVGIPLLLLLQILIPSDPGTRTTDAEPVDPTPRLRFDPELRRQSPVSGRSAPEPEAAPSRPGALPDGAGSPVAAPAHVPLLTPEDGKGSSAETIYLAKALTEVRSNL